MIPLWQLLADEGNEIQQIFKKKTSFRGSLKCLFLRMSYNYVTFLSWTFPFHKYYELELNTYVHLNCMHHAVISLWKLSQNYGFLKIYLQLHKSFGHIVSQMQWRWWTRLIISTRSLFYQDHSTQYCHPFFWWWVFCSHLSQAMQLVEIHSEEKCIKSFYLFWSWKYERTAFKSITL